MSRAASKPHRARFRFYAELNDFLPALRRQRDVDYAFDGSPAVKDAIEAQGVPHAEVDLIIVGDESVGFDYRLQPGDRVAVYPVFEAIDISPAVRVRAQPLRDPRFVLDVHLGRLARYLRLLGFDAAHDTARDDADIVATARDERRIILTRDRQLLKTGAVTHGYWVRATEPQAQIEEVVSRFDLAARAAPFTRCLSCNAAIEKAAATDAVEAPPRVRRRHSEFYRCGGCGRLYWKGTHYDQLLGLVRRVCGDREGRA
jgi:uncharacterized protein with PIN domain